jgi:hypothetical protein
MPKGHYVRTKFIPLADRLARKLVKADNGCLIWTGSRYHMGHGQIMSGDKPKRLLMTHRVAWELANGPIPVGLCVLHRCDNPPCCNPKHLFLGSKADNSADMVAKGRSKRGFDLPHTRVPEKTVAAIRMAIGPQTAIAKRFGVSQAYVSQVRSGALRGGDCH